MARDWGSILVSTRLEKQVNARFFQVWEKIIQQGLRPNDGTLSVRGKVAHKAQNTIVRQFLRDTTCDTLLTLDSDADVPPSFLEQFRSYEPGWEYDVLQAFYPRRGWPPRAIWMRRNALDQMTEWFVTEGDRCEDVDMIGTHACLFRREVFEKMLGNDDPATFEWFYYPRHQEHSEDGAFSNDAQALGFRLGATSAVRAGHITDVSITWETYQEYLDVTGRRALLERYSTLSHQIASFSGEPVDLVLAKSMIGNDTLHRSWAAARPETPEQERAYYGSGESGYLYELLHWNCWPFYERIISPLRGISGQRVLVIGTGLGTEADLLADSNTVCCFELPGVLKEFAMQRLGERVTWLSGEKLADIANQGPFDLVVAIDTLEHIHPDELSQVLDALALLLDEDGILYAHNNWHEQDKFPMHHDHSVAFDAWCQATDLERTGAYTWQRS